MRTFRNKWLFILPSITSYRKTLNILVKKALDKSVLTGCWEDFRVSVPLGPTGVVPGYRHVPDLLT